MSNSKIRLYYKNVMADVIGDEHGITERQWNDLAEANISDNFET